MEMRIAMNTKFHVFYDAQLKLDEREDLNSIRSCLADALKGRSLLWAVKMDKEKRRHFRLKTRNTSIILADFTIDELKQLSPELIKYHIGGRDHIRPS